MVNYAKGCTLLAKSKDSKGNVSAIIVDDKGRKKLVFKTMNAKGGFKLDVSIIK